MTFFVEAWKTCDKNKFVSQKTSQSLSNSIMWQSLCLIIIWQHNTIGNQNFPIAWYFQLVTWKYQLTIGQIDTELNITLSVLNNYIGLVVHLIGVVWSFVRRIDDVGVVRSYMHRLLYLNICCTNNQIYHVGCIDYCTSTFAAQIIKYIM